MVDLFILRVPAQYLSGNGSVDERALGERVLKVFTDQMEKHNIPYAILPPLKDSRGDYLYDVEVVGSGE